MNDINNKKKYTLMDKVAITTTVCFSIMGAMGTMFLFTLFLISVIKPKYNLSSYDVKCPEVIVNNSSEVTKTTKEEPIITKKEIPKPLVLKPVINNPMEVVESPINQTLTPLMSNDTIMELDNPFTLINVENDTYKDLEDETINKLNEYRLSLGLNKCERKTNLHLSAHEKANWIYANKNYSHDIIFDDALYQHGIFIRQWGINAETSRENLDISTQSDDMVEDWKISPKHNESMTTENLVSCDVAIIKLPDWYGGRGAYLGVLHMTSGNDVPMYTDPLKCSNILQCKQDNLEIYMLKSLIWKQAFDNTTPEYNNYISTPISLITGYYNR